MCVCTAGLAPLLGVKYDLERQTGIGSSEFGLEMDGKTLIQMGLLVYAE